MPTEINVFLVKALEKHAVQSNKLGPSLTAGHASVNSILF